MANIWILALHHYLSIGMLLREKEGTWDEIPYVQACMLLYQSEPIHSECNIYRGIWFRGRLPSKWKDKRCGLTPRRWEISKRVLPLYILHHMWIGCRARAPRYRQEPLLIWLDQRGKGTNHRKGEWFPPLVSDWAHSSPREPLQYRRGNSPWDKWQSGE